MKRLFSMSLLVLLLSGSPAFASFGSFNNSFSRDSVVAPVQIKDKGIYNLVVSINFIHEPYEEKVYESDEYEDFINRLKVEWSGVVIRQILQTKELNVSDLAELEEKIEQAIHKLANKLKSKYSLQRNVEVVFSLSHFYLLKPKNT